MLLPLFFLPGVLGSETTGVSKLFRGEQWNRRDGGAKEKCAGREPAHMNFCRLKLSLADLEILRGGLAAIAHEFVLNPLAFIERAQSGAFHGRNVHENVLSAVRRLNKAVAFGRVEPFHVSASHS